MEWEEAKKRTIKKKKKKNFKKSVKLLIWTQNVLVSTLWTITCVFNGNKDTDKSDSILMERDVEKKSFWENKNRACGLHHHKAPW